jgi:FdrA protein
MDALDSGCDVMIFSDNVPVAQEIRLKQVAADRGLLVLGPDCGTAVVGGVGLGFANAVSDGPVGMVAASGSGAQQVMCLLDDAGVGVSAVLGVGGRDLSEPVAGRATLAALTALDDDPATEIVLLVSKPPDPAVAAGVREFADQLATPVLPAIVGPGEPDLTAAVERALRRIGADVPHWPHRSGKVSNGAGALHGLFAGGTLCDEAMVIAAERLGPIRSNIPLRPEWQTDPRDPGPSHAMLDFGDDVFTTGRAHPIIDPSLRLEQIARALSDPDVGVLLLDVVLGYGAHPDPAAELAPLLATAHSTAVVVSLIGTPADPQDRDAQADALQRAGAHVFASNAEATRFACTIVDGGP